MISIQTSKIRLYINYLKEYLNDYQSKPYYPPSTNSMKKVYPVSRRFQHSDTKSLLTHWEQKSGKHTNLCCEKLCTNSNIDGAIVTIKGDDKLYIIPLCKEHQQQSNEIILGNSFELVEWKKEDKL